ncbi:MAG: alanine dehydrogenase, partial [Vallitaleaceae bacterium]|nr:alanine dehydrogenase [Vallitaleaceae bacterium]
MVIGVPKEIKNNENRVALTPAGVSELRKHQHKVLVEVNAGIGSGITNEEYEKAGAVLVDDASAVYLQAEIIVKVKEPIAEEYDLL